MNKYDDIKRFMDKTKLEKLDYKELNEKSTGESITGSMNQWTLIKQVSASEEPAGPRQWPHDATHPTSHFSG